MDIIIERKKLIEGLGKLNLPIVSKTNFPILSTVLIEFLEKKIRFTTTDLELTIISQIEIKNSLESKQSFCVSLTRLLSALKEFTSEQVTLKLQKNFLWITCENCELKLNIISPEEFPKIPIIKDKQGIKLNSATLKEMIRFSSFSVFVGEGNYVLSGIFCELEKNRIRFTSSDTKRLSTIEKTLPSTQPELNTKTTFIIPYKTIRELNKLLGEEEVILIKGKNQIYFDLKDTQIISQLIEGEFPQYQKYIPQESEYKLKINRVKFLSSLRRVSILSSPEYQGVKLEITKNKLIISKTTPQLGEYKEEIEANYKGKNITLGFNPDYLKDVLKIIEEEEVIFDIYESEKPIVLRNNNFIYLALPMRLS